MARRITKQQSKYELARAYAREHKLSYDAAYLFMLAAIEADGKTPRLNPDALSEAELTADERTALAAAKQALGL